MHITINKKTYMLSLTLEDYKSLSTLGGTIKNLLAYLKLKFDVREEIVALTINNESVNLKDLNVPIQCIKALTFPLNVLPSDLLSHVQRWGDANMVKSLRMVSRLMKYRVETSKVPSLIFDHHFQNTEILWPLFEKAPYRTAFKQWFEGTRLLHFLKTINETIQTEVSQRLLRCLRIYLGDLFNQQTPNTTEQKLLFALVLENKTSFLLLLLYSKEKAYVQERDYLKENYSVLFKHLEYIRFVTSINSRFNRKKQVCKRIMKYYNGSLEQGVDKHFIYDQLKTVDGLQLDQQFIALRSMKAALDSGAILLSSKEAVVLMIQAEVQPRSFSYQVKRLEVLKQQREAKEAAGQRADESEERIVSERKEIERLKAKLAELEGKSVVPISRSQADQGMMVSEAQATQAESPVAEAEENEVAQQDSKTSTARMVIQQSILFSFPQEEGLDLSASVNRSNKKRVVPMDQETAEASTLSKKGKLVEDPHADQVHLSAVEKIANLDDGTTQAQSIAPNPPPSPGR